MASDFWNIFLNVVAAFIYAGIVWLWQKRGNRPPPVALRSQPSRAESEEPLDRRAQNHQAVESAAHKFLFYFVTFGVLYLSVTMPPLFKALFSKGEVLLSQARFIGESLPPIPVGKDYLQITFFLIAAVLYWPLLALSEAITSMLHPLIDSFRPVTHRIWSAVTMLVFFLFCIPVAATSIWLFYEKSFQDALLTVLLALFLAFAFGQAQGGRR
ncbi:hypothetical protein RQP53_24620 [Paucibacter sp. APW11]|uniref:Uncharacterized protein n=1 Tax=Roseateles aquae TaxID=3077235 RepID=A0ABU3PIV4_9BURK|nr:hypothetical protein [Paucibacter sp. APW11]MDT9002479.1 hypothetical protein [Paucibacter sp. APW11]